MKNDTENLKWTDSFIAKFLNNIKTGKIKPKSCGNTNDKNGGLTSFSFPEYFCEIHVHWEDISREIIAKTHIKDLRTQKKN